MGTEAAIAGDVARGWGPVADAFRRNFAEHGELGASCAVLHEGHLVVDLWGGLADPAGAPWREDTVAMVFSVTKSAVAICANLLVERGALDLDAPVAKYWPSFAQAGKEDIRVRWLLSHRAGLPYVDASLTFEELCDWEPVVRALEAQPPLWEPGTQYAYHVITFGHLVGEVMRRVTGRSVGTFFAEEIARPLGLQSWIGLPAEHEHRVATLQPATPIELPPELAVRLAPFTGPDSVLGRAGTMGGSLPPGLVVATNRGLDVPAGRRAEIPAANMVTDARSVARLHAACIGEVDGVRLLSPVTVDAATEDQTRGCRAFGMPPGFEAKLRFGLGFHVSAPGAPLLGPRSFGHPGAGGALGIADPVTGIGFGYVPNRMGISAPDDPRSGGLLDAVRKCVG